MTNKEFVMWLEGYLEGKTPWGTTPDPRVITEKMKKIKEYHTDRIICAPALGDYT